MRRAHHLHLISLTVVLCSITIPTPSGTPPKLSGRYLIGGNYLRTNPPSRQLCFFLLPSRTEAIAGQFVSAVLLEPIVMGLCTFKLIIQGRQFTTNVTNYHDTMTTYTNVQERPIINIYYHKSATIPRSLLILVNARFKCVKLQV